MADTENQAGKTLPWDVDQFNQVINEQSKKVRAQVIPTVAPGMETMPQNVSLPEGLTVAGALGESAGAIKGAAGTGWNQLVNPNVSLQEEAQLRGGLSPIVPSVPNMGGGGGPTGKPWRQPTGGIGSTIGNLNNTGVVPTVETPAISSIVPTTPTPMQEGGGPPIGMVSPQYNMAPEAPTGAGFGGVVPTNAPTTGGIGGFVDSEMARIEKDRAEYDAYRKQKEEEQLAGLGEAGQDRLRQRIAAMAPYLEGVSKGRKARIMGGIVGEHFKSEDEMRRTLLTGRQGAEAALTTAGIRAGAVREAAIMRANTEAQKMGIDVAKLGIEQQKLGLQTGNIQSEIQLREATINDMLTKTNQIEPMKMALQESKSADERTKVQRTFWNNANTEAFKQTLSGIKAKYIYTPDSPEAVKETQDAYQKFTSGFEAGAIRFPFKGEAWNGFQYDGSKWVKQNTQ
jgi:hypothetical protein